MSGSVEPTRLLIVSQYWSPADLSGGARSTESALRSVGDDVDAWILAGDRDVGDRTPWPSADGTWTVQGRWHVSHGPWGVRSLARVRAAVRHVDPEVIYLNSVFAPGSLAVFALGLARRRRVVLAPEGELQPGSLQQSAGRKRVVLGLLRASGTLRRSAWRAADADERVGIAAVAGPGAEVLVAPEMPEGPVPPGDRPAKVAGRARLVHLATLTPKKGLRRALEALADVEGEVELTVAGPVADPGEEAACRALADALPARISVRWIGPVRHDRVAALFADHDAMILPTRGENFGYVVLEALDQGCPVLISDRTSWSPLVADGAGAVVPLDDVPAWRAAIEAVVTAGPDDAARFTEHALEAARAARRTVDPTPWRPVFLRPTP